MGGRIVRWTPEEKALLRSLRAQNPPVQFAEIARVHMPARTAVAIEMMWNKTLAVEGLKPVDPKACRDGFLPATAPAIPCDQTQQRAWRRSTTRLGDAVAAYWRDRGVSVPDHRRFA